MSQTTDPTPDAVRRTLAQAIGWPRDVVDAWSGRPDPAADLNAMTEVEAALRERGLLRDYVNAVIEATAGGPSRTALNMQAAVTAPAAVRALAAYRVVTAATQATPPPAKPPASPD